MYGSLTDFLDVEYVTETNRPLSQIEMDLESEIPEMKKKSSIRKQYNLKQSRKNKMMASTLNRGVYTATDKSQLLGLFSQNYPLENKKIMNKNLDMSLKTKKQSIQKGIINQNDYITGRKSILLKSRQGISLFESSNTKYSNKLDQQNEPGRNSQTKLRRQHNLLRAIARTKAQHLQVSTVTDYEQSFNRITNKIQKIKIKPNTIELDRDKNIQKYGNDMLDVEDIQKQISEELPFSSRSLMGVNARENQKSSLTKRKISNHQRIQFENCLSWSKKHQKSGKFYQEQLGKSGVSSREKKRSLSNYEQSKKYFIQDQERENLMSNRKKIMSRVYQGQRVLNSAIN